MLFNETYVWQENASLKFMEIYVLQENGKKFLDVDGNEGQGCGSPTLGKSRLGACADENSVGAELRVRG